ncbi:3-hydroxyacyl-CoA dehydrogenase NAD-binding domain-containing protein [Paraburkholderia terricola]|uniref:3-hydroxyacyl-CoA dehydrogenase n=1 Tax=Paraburkholderia terricola TaxID=169427 RepID=A0A1M6T2T2_9BURK|nr:MULTISPECIES: 3-hydroxyacyl-CoA dehydrogenase NAD-binding domain-containing protein [Paraburkholderia]SDO70658.1 3-hydroxyacyl-CoA dehydrogenase [Paraburkholderia sediminicola]SHK51244.1 3-hydroxyacyl-CoA dehydrogenase [Paraburkholderia terricola]
MSEVQQVEYTVEDGVAVITVDNPPVNALAPGMRESIIDGIARANADSGVMAIVLIGAGRNFIAGADIRQFGKARTVTSSVSTGALDASEKPVIAALHGYALGAGLEHALACHYRIASEDAKVGLPEVAIGVIPAGGGTQRLPRLIGPEAALDIIVTGRHVLADEALRLGIVTDVVHLNQLRPAALSLAKRVADVRPLPRLRDRTERIGATSFERAQWDAAREKAARRAKFVKAPHCAIACIEAALDKPFDEGIQLEQRLFAELETSDQAKALRYAFFAEREAAKIPGVPAALKPKSVRLAAVIGAGTMGSGIAMCFADAGIPVKLLEATPEALERGLKRIRDTYATKVKRGSLTQQEMDARMGYIEPAGRYEEIGHCDVVVEAVFERIDLKKEVFSKLDAVMKEGALLLTNSSAIDINTMGAMTGRPADVAGAHFFAPANVMKLCEVVRGDQTSIETIVRAAKMGRDLGKVSVVSGTCDGFAANRSRALLVTEMMLMLEEGALPEQIDKVMVEFGYPMGPFAVSDLSGLDVSYDTRKRRAAADPTYRKLHVPDRMVEMGRKGQKSGAGWYRYNEGDRTPYPDDEVRQIIAGVAEELGIAQRTFTDEEILRRMLFASINEACKILEDGKAYRASDIDVMWLYGFGFPRHRGGVMYWADSIGAKEIYRQVCEWHERYGKRWEPSRLLAEMAQSGGLLRDVKGRMQ